MKFGAFGKIPYKIIALFLLFVLGAYFYIVSIEGLTDQTATITDAPDTSCPDMLIKSGNALLLYNSKLPESATNPLPFYNLDEYIRYVESERKKGNRCPVLFLQEEVNTQGQTVYRVRPSPFDPQAGLPRSIELLRKPTKGPMKIMDASRDNNYNTDMYAGFDPYGQHVGQYTTLDKIHDSTRQGEWSENPMDPNWGGVMYTKQAVDSGKYKENEVSPPRNNGQMEEKSDNVRISSIGNRNIFA
jgi:hypothetical protein